jgi:TolB-like protein
MRYLFEEYTFDIDRRELHRGADLVSIAPQVFDLLDYLIRSRDRVVSKDELISAIWGGRIITDAALATRLNALRVAIGDTGEEQRLIKTLPRKGFRFVGPVLETAEQDDAAVPNRAVQTSTKAPGLSGKPSIAVMPFENMSADPEQEYFADGLVDDIITDLSRFRSFFVIARNSSFTYKGKAVDIKQIGHELGVRYVLEGSVRKAGNQLRINAQLIDVATSTHLWADRFEGTLGDIFDLQDKLAHQVVGAIAPEVDRAEIERASRRRVGKIDAVTAYYRGLRYIHFPTTPENNDAAAKYFEQAIALDPSFAHAYGGAAGCIAWRRANRWPGDIAGDNIRLIRFAERLKELGTDDAFALGVVGFLLFWFALDFDGGIELIERAIRFNPTYARALHYRGLIRGWQGGSDAAIADLELAMRLSPREPSNYAAMLGLALAHHNAGRHTEAGEWTDKAVRAFPPAFYVGVSQAILCYVGAERLGDARKLMAEGLRMSPGARQSTFSAPHYSPKLRAELLEALIEAGLPE